MDEMDMTQALTLREGESRNFIRLSRLLICGGVEVLRNLFDHLHPPASALKISKGPARKKESSMSSSDLFNVPLPSQSDSSKPFDTTVRWFVCSLQKSKAGWELPDDEDFSLRADVARIMFYRNNIVEYGMGKNCGLTKDEFENYWQKIQSALTRIVRDYSGTDFEAVASWEKRICEYRTAPVTEEDDRNWEQLKCWYDMDKKLRCSEIPEDIELSDEIKEVGCTATEKKEVTSPEHDLVQHTFSWNSEKVKNKKWMKPTCLKSCSWSIDECNSICLLRTLCLGSKSRFAEELKEKPEEMLEMVDVIAPKYYLIRGTKALDSGRYSVALDYFNRSLKSSPDKELLFRATLENNIGSTLMIEKDCAKALMTFRRALQIMNCKAFENEDNELADIKSSLIFCLKNNYGCAELDAGNYEEALSVFKILYEDEVQIKSCDYSEQRRDRLLMSVNIPDVPVENPKEPRSSHLRYSDKLNLVSVVLNYSQACLLSGNLYNVDEMLQDILYRCQFSEHQQMISVRLARILTLQGKRRKVDEIIDLQEIDRLTIQRVLEDDSFGSFSGMYTEDICRILVYRGERTKSRELLLFAAQVCQQTSSNRKHPLVLSLKKTTEELFPNQVIEKASSNSSTDLPLFRPSVVTNVCFEYAMQVLKDERLRENLVRELDVTKTTLSYEKMFADMYASEKHTTPSPEVTVISTVCMCAFLSQQEISGTETEPYLEKQLAKITSLNDVLNETLVSKTTISFLCDYESCFMAAVCSLLEIALLQRVQTWVNKICEPLVSFLALRGKDEGNEMEWYKDYCGLLSYFVSVDHSVPVSGGEISLYVIVTCGSGLNRSKDVAGTPESDPLFTRVINDAETDKYGTTYLERRSRYFVFLRSNDLIDINELRLIKKTITESLTCLELLSVNAVYQGNVFIDIVPEIDPRNLQDLCLDLYSLRACLVKNEPGPLRTPNTQPLYLQKLQRQLTFEEEGNIELFIALFQHTFYHLQMVHVQHKTRKKFVCIFKEPPFSLLTLHVRSTVVFLTLHDVTDTCLRNNAVTNNTPKLIDDVMKDCYDKLNFSYASESRHAWCEAVDVQNQESEDDDDLEKAQKANARLTLELEYLKGKAQRLADRTRELFDKLSEMEARAFLYQQHFVQTTSSDKNKARAVENWIAHRKNSTGDEDDNEESLCNERFNLEECLESISNDELVEMLADIHRPDLVQTRDEAEEICFEEKQEGANGISLDRKPQDHDDGDDSEGKRSSNRPSWWFPSPESSKDFSTLNEVAGKIILKEEWTQTDSLSSVDEHRNAFDQTEPSQLTNEDSLMMGQANFERDRAERQLRRSRIAYDILALKRRSRETTSGSSRDSIVSTTPTQEKEVIYNDGTFQEFNVSGYCSKPIVSIHSIGIEISSQDKESISSDGASQESNVSQLSKRKASKCSIGSETSSQDKEGIGSDGTSRESIVSECSPKPMASKYSVVSRTSRQNTESISSEGTTEDSNVSQLLSKPKTSKDSIASETSSQETEDISIEDTLQESNVSRLLPKLKSSKDSTASKTSSGVSLSSNSKASLGTPPDSISPDFMPKQDSDTTETESNGREPSVDESSSGISSIKEPNHIVLIDQNNENRHSAISDSKMCLYNTEECGGREDEMNASMMLGAAHLKKEEYDDAISYSRKCLGIAQECGDKEAEMNAYYTLGNAYLNTGQHSGAVLYSERFLAIAREYGNKVDEMNACVILGIAHLKKEEYDDAISYSKKCVDIAQECGDKATQIKAYGTLGAAHLKKEEYDDAISYSKKCLDIVQECGDKVAKMNAFRTLGNALKENDLKYAMPTVVCQEGIQPPPQWNEGDMVDGRPKNQEIQNRTFHKPVLITCEEMVSTTQSLFQERTKASGKVSRSFGAKIKTNEIPAGDRERLEDNDNSRYIEFSRDCRIATTTKQDSGCDVNRDNTCKNDENMTPNGSLESAEVIYGNGARTRRDPKALEGNYDSDVCNGGKPSKERARSSRKSSYSETRTGLFEQVESDGGEVRRIEGASVVPSRRLVCDDVTRTSHYETPRDVVTQLSEPRVAFYVTSTSHYDTPREVVTQLNEARSVDILINHEKEESGKANKFEIAAATPLPEVGEILKTHEREKSLDKECVTSPDNFQDSSKLGMNEECEAIGTTKEDFLASNENNAGETSSSFEKISQCLSLPCSLVSKNSIATKGHDVLYTTERTRLKFSDESQNKIDETCRESLSVIKEIDDSQGTASNRAWDLQGARPKIQNHESLIEERSDFTVSGVDSSFLARHSNDSSLKRSIYSRAVPDHGAFLSLPAINERRSFPSLARTWPIGNEREVTLPSGPSLLGQPLRSSHDQQGKTNNTDNIVGSTGSRGVKTRLLLSGEMGTNGNNLSVGQETSLGNSHPNEIQTIQREDITANCTGFVNDQEGDKIAEQSFNPFNQIHASQFALISDSIYEDIPLHGSTNTQNSSSRSSMESFNTADSSLQSLEDKIEATCMTLSQMSESTLLNQELERQYPDNEHQTENENETVFVAGNDQNMQWGRENENISEGDRKVESGQDRELMESRSGHQLWDSLLSLGGFWRAEEETREASSNSHSQLHIFVRGSGVHEMNLAAAQATSLSAQRVPAKTYEELERERRKTVTQERQKLRKKEAAENERRLQASREERERRPPSSPMPASLPVQESTEEGPCSHYKRRCQVRFPCCKQFYPCHRCHNNSDLCQEEDKKALDSTHLKCSSCSTEQEITKDSHHCKNCNIQLSEYFCGICKHFTGNEKNPYHCKHCGICRVHRDRSFHCEVCNVCLDNRLKNNHKCRPNSGHDECCICLEDAFGGCQILPCSHKVHRECAVAMLKNGVRKCPICRSPLYQ